MTVNNPPNNEQVVTSHSVGNDGRYYTSEVRTRNGVTVYYKISVYEIDIAGDLILVKEDVKIDKSKRAVSIKIDNFFYKIWAWLGRYRDWLDD